MSLPVARSKLLRSLHDLEHRLQPIRREWDDRVRREFEARYVEPLEGATKSAVAAIEHFEQAFARARRDCE